MDVDYVHGQRSFATFQKTVHIIKMKHLKYRIAYGRNKCILTYIPYY